MALSSAEAKLEAEEKVAWALEATREAEARAEAAETEVEVTRSQAAAAHSSREHHRMFTMHSWCAVGRSVGRGVRSGVGRGDKEGTGAGAGVGGSNEKENNARGEGAGEGGSVVVGPPVGAVGVALGQRPHNERSQHDEQKAGPRPGHSAARSPHPPRAVPPVHAKGANAASHSCPKSPHSSRPQRRMGFSTH